MKKTYLVRISILLVVTICMCLFASCGIPDENIVISEDYMTITYNSEEYSLSEYYVSMPDDCVVYETPTVENANFWHYLLPISGDTVHISNSEPAYLWLTTETDHTDNEKFAEIQEKNSTLLYVRTSSDSSLIN